MLVKEHGFFKGLFAGIGPTLMREIIGNVAYFGVYETIKQTIIHKRQIDEGSGVPDLSSLKRSSMPLLTLHTLMCRRHHHHQVIQLPLFWLEGQQEWPIGH